MAKSSAITIENGPKYPRIKVQMIRTYVGFHSTVTAVQAAMRQAGLPLQELSTFYADAAEGTEDNLLRTCRRWVDVDVRRPEIERALVAGLGQQA
jgi:hypothetical protein